MAGENIFYRFLMLLFSVCSDVLATLAPNVHETTFGGARHPCVVNISAPYDPWRSKTRGEKRKWMACEQMFSLDGRCASHVLDQKELFLRPRVTILVF